MRLLNLIDEQGRTRLGVAAAAGVLDVAALAANNAWADAPASTDEVLARPATLTTLRKLAGAATTGGTGVRAESSVHFAPCVLRPEKIICIGLNYRQHAIESKMPIPVHPVVFSKFNNSLSGHGDAIHLAANAFKYDYEVELGVVIGATARDVPVADALQYVFGYCTINDFSARDLQFQTSQWLLGKTPDGFMPIGPYLVTADEVPDPQALTLKCWVNGELRQDSSTADMIFPVREIISHLSWHMTLKPGDVISTGTPQGVAVGMENPVWIKPGDETTVEISSLGRLSNRYVAR